LFTATSANVVNNLNIGGNLYVAGNSVTTGTQQANGNFLPVQDNVYTVGNSTARFIVYGTTGTFSNITLTTSGNIKYPDGSIQTTAFAPGANTQVIFNDSSLANSSASFTYNKASSTLSISNTVSSNTILLTNASETTTNYSCVSVLQQIIDSFSKTQYRSAQYLIQLSDGISYHLTNVTIIHDGVTPYITEYGAVLSNAPLGILDVSVSGGFVNLLLTPTNASVVVRLVRKTINI
jgi:flagellar hook-basal body complex protein FliE